MKEETYLGYLVHIKTTYGTIRISICIWNILGFKQILERRFI